MTKVKYYIPYAIWIIIVLILVENSMLDKKFSLISFIIYSFIISFSLEVIRNRLLNNAYSIKKTRSILYFTLNFLIGMPLFTIIYLVMFPIESVTLNNETDFDRWQQYLALGYFMVWFLINSVILKPSRLRNILLFIISPLILVVSTLILTIFLSTFISYYF